MANEQKFPSDVDAERIQSYEYFDKLFKGKHFDAFKIRVPKEFTARYAEIRYLTCNFMGLVSKVVADLLFGDEVSISMPEDGDQEFVDAMVAENTLHIQNYESAIANSRRGDALYRLRIGKRNPSDDKEIPTLIIEDINPMFYYPTLDPTNVRATPISEMLAYVFKKDTTNYLHQEIHTPGLITNKVFEYDVNKHTIIAEMTDVTQFGFEPTQQTKIKRSLLFHIPNFKDGSSYFGTSDYTDLESLAFALNNRMTKIDNILDKHSDPILAVPDGVLDENGEIRAEAFGMIEMNEDGSGKPEYIVWDANLEAAFKQIDKLVQFMFMFSETSETSFGLDGSASSVASGRALKLQMYRTLAKTKRKQIYYDQALKDLLFTAQELAKAWTIKYNDKTLEGEPMRPMLDWPDPLNNLDTFEAAQEEQIRLETGTTTKVDSIMRLDGLTREQAEDKVEEIKEEEGASLPMAAKPVVTSSGETPATPAEPTTPTKPTSAPKPAVPAGAGK